ncbi:homeobox [Puccinia graminis f. sp. tritici]|uniref:Homeobox n=1 Tax=Puccinia graminis f. sp. tritici TaxID=56615 RepID=A0A5B0S4U4_PUCGR|nr:homeobox [Puccinia graminis f. sp. tritici]
MSLPEADGMRARANSNGGGCLDHEIISRAYGEDGCEIPLAFNDHNLRAEWSSATNLGAKIPTHTGSSSTSLAPPLGLSSPGFELPANPVTLPQATWDPLIFPSQLEQMNLGNPASDDFLRHQFDFLNTNSQTELLSYDYNQPVMVSSPTCQLSETDSFLPFENSTQTSATYHQMSLPNPNIFSKATESREISPFMPLSQEAACGLAVCSSASQPLPILSPPLGLDYYTLETSRAAPLIGSKRSLPIMNRGEMSQNAHEIKESLLGFEGRGGPGFMHDFNVLPNTTSKYPIESFHETGESSSHLSWDMRTRSSSSRSPSYDQSSSEHVKYPLADANTSDYHRSSHLLSSLHPTEFSPHNLPARSGAYQPEKSTTSGKKQNSPQVSGSRDYQTNQKRVGSLIDIHHLTNHVPRRRLTVEQEQILLRRFAVQEYLSKREMEELAEKLKIPTSQLRTWFGNRRSKLKAAARQKAKMEAGMGHFKQD